VFSTTEDNQNVVRIHALQGEREMAADNKSLGRFELLGIPPAPRGVPQIEVSFEIDTDGVVSVSAKDLGTGKLQQIRVAAAGGLTQDEIGRLIGEAQQFASDDKARRDLVELMNKADGLVYSTERSLEEYAQHIGEDERQSLVAAIEKTRVALATRDLPSLTIAVDELSALSYQMTEQLYAKLGSSGSQ
jgi:molecular chaperone DnaK